MSSMTNDASKGRGRAIAATAAAFVTGMAPQSAALAQAPPGVSDEIYRHIIKAREVAGDALSKDFYYRCFIDPNYRLTIAAQRKQTAAIPPVKVFDNLYFIGQNNVSAWALRTSEGFVVFDALNTPDEANEFIEGGFTKLGLDPRQIKYVVLMHEHSDHFGGAKYLHDKFGAILLASPIAWTGIAKHTGHAVNFIPERGRDLIDGQRLTLGDTTLTFYATPGHSPGTISTIFKVTDYGEPHVVGLFGGMGTPAKKPDRQTIIKSFERWQKLTATAGVDTLIANHQGQDGAVENLEFIKVRRRGDANPFVLGRDLYQRYFTVQTECTYALLDHDR